jgi:hypothetical protein
MTVKTLQEYVDAAVKMSHLQRCLLDGCRYFSMSSDYCVYCGMPKRSAAPLAGRSIIADLRDTSIVPVNGDM